MACPDKAVKSLHVQFARAGRPQEPVRYEVTRHHEGGSFATLTVVAKQTQGVAAVAAVSLHSHEDGPDQQIAFPMPRCREPSTTWISPCFPGTPGPPSTWTRRSRSHPSTTCGCAHRPSPRSWPRR
ncbi:acyl-CoA thioesterase domain-containing protein [Streptomyces sp. N50]|uniref:acyl-CoA thioesterase domain-containing protein n=1 Tax=Streptomyces sp. N50 TaxID=3081765 RepID=UPI00398D150D